MDTGATPRGRILRRHQALRALRAFFEARDFVEVETSACVVAPTTEPHIDPLSLPLRLGPEAAPVRRYLRTSPELALKRIVAAGVPRIFELARVFRDGERGPLHLPEFDLLEWYRAGADLPALVSDLEELSRSLALTLTGTCAFRTHAGQMISLEEPFERVSVESLFRQHASVDLGAALAEMAEGDSLALVRRTRAAGHALREGADFEDAFFHVMTSRIEPRIGQTRPVIVERWPRQMAVLARICDDDRRYAERFELYAGGVELANAFDELTDPQEQRQRFVEDNRLREALGKAPLPIDEVFLTDLARMPRTVGIALGWDRLLLLLYGAATIDDVQALPFR